MAKILQGETRKMALLYLGQIKMNGANKLEKLLL